MPLQATSGAASYDGFGGGVPFTPTYIEDVFSTWLYTGNGSTQTITNGIDLSTKGGLVWLKYRSGSTGSTFHHVYDSARGKSGFSSYNYLYTNDTSAQGSGSSGPTSFNSDGFSLNSYLNASTIPYVSWTFRKQPKFFDVVTWTGNGTNPRQIAHNLGSVPGCIIVKSTTRAENWTVYHRSLGNAARMALNTTDGQVTGTGVWASTTPTSTYFTVSADNLVNFNGDGYVAYLFAHDAGGFGLTGTDNVITCGSFTTDGSGNATINLGYEPQWFLRKRTDDVGSWTLVDNMRGFTADGTDAFLYPNLSNAEATSGGSERLTSTGVQITGFGASMTFIYIAIRRGPMKTPTTGTSVYNAVAYTGDGSTTREISTSITPDLAMTQGRSSSYVPFWCSRLSGAPLLYSSSTDAERLASGFTNGGFTINTNSQAGIVMAAGSGGTANNSNANGADFINWNFRRAPGFFDVVCYTGNGAQTARNHNLGVVPELMLLKRRSGTGDWDVSTGYGASTYSRGALPYTNAFSTITYGTGVTYGAAPTATTFTTSQDAGYNASGATYVAYLFASCPGVSKVGSYTGTGSTLQINCGFTGGARFVLIKRTDSTGEWYVWDSARGIVAGNDPYLLLNSAGSEQSGTDWVDTHSPGFELSNSAGNLVNTNGGTYIFLAIA